MPNNTTDVLVINGKAEDIKALKSLLLTEEAGEEGGAEGLRVDFNRVVPMPESLQVACGGRCDGAYTVLFDESDAWKRYLSYNWVPGEITTREELAVFLESKEPTPREGEPTWRELGEIYRDNKAKYGHTTWYDWCLENWGTKWNAYETEVVCDTEDRLEVAFQTAWSPPVPVYQDLAEKFPSLDVSAYWSDEGSYERARVF